MKKKFYLVAALLGAMTLGTSCVDDNESASVTAVRTAKAEQLSALATKAKAEAEAAIITAEAEKAYKDALTKYTEEMTAEAKAKFEAELEAIKAEAEERIKQAKLQALIAEQEFINKTEGYLQTLYVAYSNAAEDLADMKTQKASKEYRLARLEAYMLNINEYIAQETADYQKQIKEKEADIEAWKKYSGIDKSTLETKQKDLMQQKFGAYKVQEEAETASEKAEEVSDKALEAYNAWENIYTIKEEVSSVKAVAAVQKFYQKAKVDYSYFNDYNSINTAMEQGYLNENTSYEYVDGQYKIATIDQIYEDGMWLPVNPIGDKGISVTDNKAPYINASFYTVNNKNMVAMDRFLADKSQNAVEHLERLKTRLAQYEDALKAEQEALPALEEAFAAAEKAYNDANAVAEAARAKVQEAEAAYEPIRAEEAGYQEEKNKAYREYDAANTEYQAQEQLKNRYTAEKNYATSNKENNTNWKKTATDNLKAQEEALKNATAEEKPAIEATIKNLKEEIARYDAAIAEAEAVIKRADAKIKAAETAMKTAETAMATAQKAINAAQAKIDALSIKYQDVHEAVEAAERAWRAAQEEVRPLQNKKFEAESAVNKTKEEILSLQKDIASVKDQIINKEEWSKNAPEIEAAWKEVVAALNADYEAEVKALAENADVKAYLEAYTKYEEAQDAYNNIVAELGTVNEMLEDNMIVNPAEKIEELQADITALKKDIEELKQNYPVGGQNAEQTEQAIAETKAAIEKLEGQIAIQEEIVKAAKKRVDDYLAQSGK